MVHVLATIHVKPGSKARFLDIFNGNVPAVKAENGCLEYRPTVDADSGLPNQVLDPDSVIIIEKWESPEALRAHLAAPHMAAYRLKVKDLVSGVSLRVMQDA